MELAIYNRGRGGDGKLTWSTLSNTVLGVAVVLEEVGCTSARWEIQDAEEGEIGFGVLGEGGVDLGALAVVVVNGTLGLGGGGSVDAV